MSHELVAHRCMFLRLDLPFLLIALLVAAACSASPSPSSAPVAAGESISCPSSIRTRQTIANPSNAWDANASEAANRLVYIELYDGAPEDGQAIEPDETRDQAKEEILIWRFSGEPAKAGIWLLCGYQQTQVKLQRKLPDAVRECTQTNSRDRSRPVRLLAQTCR